MRRGDFLPRVIPGTRYYLRSKRPAALAKDQPKRFETPMFVVDAIPLTIAPELKTSSGSLVEQAPERLLPLKRHQYHCVVMTDTADTYRYLSVMPSIRNLRLNKWLSDTSSVFSDDEAMIDYSQSSLDTFQIDSLYYKVTYSDWDGGVELPANAQQWSSIAYLLWADFAPERMSQEQQTALLDWLHFGGQLIVGGDAMADLNQSFLKDYLPATPTGSVNEPLTALNPIFEGWTLERGPDGQRQLPEFAANESFVRTQWEVRPESQELPGTDGHVVERTVGKGRVVATSFPLNLTRLRGWRSLDHWFNCCLLRRPGRLHQSEEQALGGLESTPMPLSPPVAESMSGGKPFGFRWLDGGLSTHDPGVYTTFDIAARDWGASRPNSTVQQATNQSTELAMQASALERRFGLNEGIRSRGEWNDYSDFSQAARASLKEQAGITPPSREWVLKALAIYLLILVPVNYTIFRLFRRLELAWFSTPLIAIVGGIVIVRAASLDIGFSNKNLQVNVIEIPVGYTRGHLTGYGSLYSSLTTQFRFESQNPTTLALPFPASNEPREVVDEPIAAFQMDVGSRLNFGPQQVLSNTMEMYHFQQMIDLGGRFEWRPGDGNSPDRLLNRTDIDLADVGIFRCDPQTQELSFCFIESIGSGSEQNIQWRSLTSRQQVVETWKNTSLADRQAEIAGLLQRLATDESSLLALNWVEAAKRMESEDPEWAEAVRRLGLKRNLDASTLVTFQMLDSALQSREAAGLSLGRLFGIATRYPLGPGEVRLVGWSDKIRGEWDVIPKASQAAQRSLVLAHLAPPQLPALGFDRNLAYPPRAEETDQENPAADPWDFSDSNP